MKKEFIVERHGRPFVMYAGLLHLAHESGLKSIRTELIQAPTAENGAVAICAATVVLERNGAEHCYTGIGDAAENNVAAAMRSSLIRMAETRAKARALRDAVNVGVSAFEELNDVDGTDSGPKAINNRSSRSDRPSPSAARTSPASPGTTKVVADSDSTLKGSITPAQKNAIGSMCRAKSLDPDTVAQEQFEVEDVAALSSQQAGTLIRTLSAASRSRVAVAA